MCPHFPESNYVGTDSDHAIELEYCMHVVISINSFYLLAFLQEHIQSMQCILFSFQNVFEILHVKHDWYQLMSPVRLCMKPGLVYICLILLTGITEDPQPRNVSVNTKATFTCTGIGDSIWWNSNGVQLDDNEPNVDVKFKLVNELGSMSTLKILVSSPDNPTNITCVVFSSSSNTFDVSNPALLLVQGR